MTAFIISILAGLFLATVASAVHLLKEYANVKRKIEEKEYRKKNRESIESVI
jgi:hypothetical protein